jgi:hypothetical protein
MSRNIFGWDLPPGCSANDLPGNRPEDQASEAFYDAFYEAELDIRTANPSMGDDYVEALAAWVYAQTGKSFGDGYAQGAADERTAAEYKSSEKRNADRVDGYDRDDLGESPDY